MVLIKKVSGETILDSRKEKTILVTIKTDKGIFSASSPTGKSRGKYEAEPYKKNIKNDIENLAKLSDYFSEEFIESFEDLRKIKDIVGNHVGANTIFAFESAVLKALANENKKEIWQIINPDLKKAKFPRLVGNCIGGGKHSHDSNPEDSEEAVLDRKPDFQEFLLIPDLKSVEKSQEKNKEIKEKVRDILKLKDKKFSDKKTDEDAWKTSLNEKEVLDVLDDFKVQKGVDIAASSFHKRKKYSYENPVLKRTDDEQFEYISNLIKNTGLYYIEDPFHEDDFKGFSNLLKKFPDSLIVGDDLITTNYKRLKKAIEMGSVNAIIVKPNQIGSLIEVKNVCDLAKENGIKIVFSHRSGETSEDIIADLAFGFQADFFKSGITGREREAKINRLIKIQENYKG